MREVPKYPVVGVMVNVSIAVFNAAVKESLSILITTVTESPSRSRTRTGTDVVRLSFIVRFDITMLGGEFWVPPELTSTISISPLAPA